MIILAMRSDKPQAELYLYEGSKKLSEIKWQAHLKLAETLNFKIEEMLGESKLAYEDLNGLAIFKGPGSFTGLRIGMSVANALAYGLNIPVIAKGGEGWLEESIADLSSGKFDKMAVPEYGAPARTTKPRK